jgi:CBS-domain-containing membrane protein
MIVRDHMSSPAITVTAKTPFQEALKLLQTAKIRRLPVVDRHGDLVGWLSAHQQKDENQPQRADFSQLAIRYSLFSKE